jgi:curved DNA-binding protein CbpA
MQATQALDYYEFLQISPNADSETVHRVYRFLASRFHPDNPESGDPEKFYLLKSAYDVLSDSAQRAKYDSARSRNEPEKQPMSSSVDFMDNLDGELNRRLAVLAVLYYRRRSNPYNPEVGLPEIEKRMGFPRDYLDFTTWYLTRKGYVTKADNSDFALTAEGVDFVESQRSQIPVLNKLLTSGNEAAVSAAAEAGIASLDIPIHVPAAAPEATAPDTSAQSVAEPASHANSKRNGPAIPGLASITISEVMPKSISASDKVVMVGKAIFKDRRGNAKERRTGAPDWRTSKVERRSSARDRRADH